MYKSFIASRLIELNQQLKTIYKLQNMEDDSKTKPNMKLNKNNNTQNNSHKMCHCIHHVLSPIPQNMKDDYIPHILCQKDVKKQLYNIEVCKSRRKPICLCNAIENNVRRATRYETDNMEEEINEIMNSDTTIINSGYKSHKQNNVLSKESTHQAYNEDRGQDLELVNTNSVMLLNTNIEKNVHYDTSTVLEKENQSLIPEVMDPQTINTLINPNTNNIINTYDKDDIENIPTREDSRQSKYTQNNGSFIQELNSDKLDNSLKRNYNTKENINESIISESKNENISVWNKNNYERMEKDIINEKKHTKELEEKLENVKYDLICLKENRDQQINCLKEALDKAEEEIKLAKISRDLAMELVKKSKDEIDVIKTERNKILDEIPTLNKQVNDFVCKNAALSCECKKLKCKLQAVSENEAKKCFEIANEIKHIKCVIKEKEEVFITEKSELKDMITKLTNVITVQKMKICELTKMSNKQRSTLKEKNKIFAEKDIKISEMQSMIKLSNCKCTELKDEIQTLKTCLDKEVEACNHFKKELECFKDDSYCTLRIKEKMIDEQNETIKRQKKLLQDSQKIAQQTGQEFEQLRDELLYERQTSDSLRIALDTAEAQLNDRYLIECENCKNLQVEMNSLNQQHQKALAAAKITVQKQCMFTKELQQQLINEKEQYKFLTLVLQRKKDEIKCLQQELNYDRNVITHTMNSYVL